MSFKFYSLTKSRELFDKCGCYGVGFIDGKYNVQIQDYYVSGDKPHSHYLEVTFDEFEDAKEISRANGIGKKTAERIILELKDKMGKLDGELPAGVAVADISNVSADARTEAISAMVALGYTKAEAFSAVSAVNDEGLTSEEYIKKALKNLF